MSYADKKFNPWRIKNGTRVLASEAMWRQPVKWNKESGEGVAVFTKPTGKLITMPYRPRVFCASMADVFEDWDGPIMNHYGRQICHVGGRWQPEAPDSATAFNPVTLNDVRRRLFDLIDATPNLDWLLLTKRPEHIRNLWPGIDENLNAPYRSNVWLGVSIANQEDADRNIPLLLQCRDLSPVLFVSYEPAVGPVKFGYACLDGIYERIHGSACGTDADYGEHVEQYQGPSLDWIIIGGESGPNARPFDVSWARSTVRQCADAGVPCFVKQLGSVPYMESYQLDKWALSHDRKQLGPGLGYQILLKAKKGDDPLEWPEDLRVRQFPEVDR